MKKIITKTKFLIAGAAGAILMFPLVTFAALGVTPPVTESVSETTATLVAHVEDPSQTITVWFEWGETPALGRNVGMMAIWNSGFASGRIMSLKPGTTYYARVVAIEGGQRVESSVVTFVTASPLVQTASVVTPSNNTTVNQPANNASQVKPTAKATAKPVAKVTKKETPKATTTSSQGFQSQDMAAVFGIGDSVFPTTLIGWIALIIALFVVVLLGHSIFKSIENRKKEEDALKEAEAANAEKKPTE